jgi:hypothetical protein
MICLHAIRPDLCKTCSLLLCVLEQLTVDDSSGAKLGAIALIGLRPALHEMTSSI